MKNNQPIEKQVSSNVLQVHSIFYTIQGEGPFTGTPAVFIRLAGCNLQCPACDTDYTSSRTEMLISQIVSEVESHAIYTYLGRCLVVITGGEPFRQDIKELILELDRLGYYVQIETNGTLPLPMLDYSQRIDQRSGVYVVCSPKTAKIHKSVQMNACAFKYVVTPVNCDALCRSSYGNIKLVDGLPLTALDHPAKPHIARPVERCFGTPALIYVQPADEKDAVKNERNLTLTKDIALTYGYILQIQTHKLLGVE